MKPSLADINNYLGKDYSDFQNFINGGLIFKEASSKLSLSQPPPTGQESSQILISEWEQGNMCTFEDFLR